ncbi:MAG: hypothetical protein R2880_16595 [Deinococcales bacterium]
MIHFEVEYLKLTKQRIEEDNATLEKLVAERTKDLEKAHLEMLNHLATAGEKRDDETGEHTFRVGQLAAWIAEKSVIKVL